MNSKERLKRLYTNQEVDRPGVYCRVEDIPENDSTYFELKNYIYNNTEVKKHWNGRAFEIPLPMDVRAEPYSEDFERVITTLHTPKGDLTSSMFRGLKGNAGLHETNFIKTYEDAEKYLALPLPEVRGDVSSFYIGEKKLGDRGVMNVHIGLNPAGYVTELLGIENFAIMTVTDRDIIHALIEREMNVTMNSIKFLLENKVGPFFCVDGEEYIVPPLHGAKDFYDFNVKYDKQIIDLVHNAGGYMHVHSHGSIKSVLQGFIDMGADVLHPFEPPPMGNITAKEAKNIIRGKLCMEGNIQIAYMYEHTPEELREETENLIKDAFDDHKGLIVSNSASPYLIGKGLDCLEQYKAMINTVLQWKG